MELNLFVKCCYVPTYWREGLYIGSLFKNVDREDFVSYSLVTLLGVISYIEGSLIMIVEMPRLK